MKYSEFGAGMKEAIKISITLSMHILTVIYLTAPLSVNDYFYSRLSSMILYFETNFVGYANLSRIVVSGQNFDVLLIGMIIYMPIYSMLMIPYLYKLIQNGMEIRKKLAIRYHVYVSLYIVIPVIYYFLMILDIRLEETRNGLMLIKNIYVYALFLATLVSVTGVLLSAMLITPIVELRNNGSIKEGNSYERK